MKNSNNIKKIVLWAIVIALVLFVALPTLLAFVEFALSLIASLVMLGLFLVIGFIIYRTLTK